MTYADTLRARPMRLIDKLGVYGEPRGDMVVGVTDCVVTIVAREHE